MAKKKVWKKVFETENRDASHRALEYVLRHRKKAGVDKDFRGTEKFAELGQVVGECRENPNAKKPYSVWVMK